MTLSKQSLSRSGGLSRQGFTLVELLMVIVVIAILAGISVSVYSSVQNTQSRSRAKADIAYMAQALEQFKAVNGDYPWTSSGGDTSELVLSKSLLGWKEFAKTTSGTSFQDKTSVPNGGPKVFVEPEKFNYTGTVPDDPETKPTDLVFVDPWGNAYVYEYKTTAAWDNFGYVLYSKGDDGVDTPVSADGILDSTHTDDANNLDNLYLGK